MHPDLDQSAYPPLPQIPERTTLILKETPFKKVEKEYAIAALLTVCIRQGKYTPVSLRDFMAVLANCKLTRLICDPILEAAHGFILSDQIQLVTPEGRDSELAEILLIISPELVEQALSGKVIYTR